MSSAVYATALPVPSFADAPPPSAEALLHLVAAGDRSAFDALCTRFAGIIHAVVFRSLRDHARSEEVTQDVLIEVWRKARTFDPRRSNVTTWLSTIAHHRAVDRVRAESAATSRERRAADQSHDVPFDDVSDAVVIKLEHERLRRALADLSQRQREAIHLTYYQGHTFVEAAHLLGIPVGTLKTRIRDCHTRLRRTLA